MGLSSLCIGFSIEGQCIWTNQVVTQLSPMNISWSLTILCMISSSGYKPNNWSCITSISCNVWWCISTDPLIREGKITPNWTDIVQCCSKSGAPENIELKDTYFTPYLNEDPRKPQVTSRAFPQRIIIKILSHRSPYQMYKNVWTARERLSLTLPNIQLPKTFEANKI